MPLNIGGLKLLHTVIYTPSYCLKINQSQNYTHTQMHNKYNIPSTYKKKSWFVLKEMIYSV